MEIVDIGVNTIEVKDEKDRHSSVSTQNGKWYCLRCSRFRCEHALFVARENPKLVEVLYSQEEMASIIDTG